MGYGLHSWTFLDHSNEAASMGINVAAPTAAGFDAQQSALLALQVAIEALTGGQVVKDQTSLAHQYTRTIPPSQSAQRENKFIVIYEDATLHTLHKVEMPTANLAASGVVIPAGTDDLDLSQTEVAAFIAAFEAVAKAPRTLNNVNVVRIYYSGTRS